MLKSKGFIPKTWEKMPSVQLCTFLRHRLVIMLDGPEVQIFYFRKDSEENTKKVNPHPSNNNYFKITYMTFKK